MHLTASLVVIFILLLLSAFFSSSETAFIRLDKIKLRHLKEHKAKNSTSIELIEKLLHDPSRFLTTVLVGNTLVNIAASSLATVLIIRVAISFGFFNMALLTFAVTGIMTVIILIFTEIIPKTIALKKSERVAFLFVRPLYYFSRLFSPIIYSAAKVSTFLTMLFGINISARDTLVSEESIRALVGIGEEEGVLESEEKEMIDSIFYFRDTVVREVMTPRTDMIGAEMISTPQQVIDIIIQYGHSRIPMYQGSIDKIIGVIYAKDLLRISASQLHDPQQLQRFRRDPYFIPESKKVDELLREMRTNKMHIAIVLDEYGGTSGFVTIEDLLEEIVGEIKDEYDGHEKPEIESCDEKSYIVSGNMNLDDVNTETDLLIATEGNFDTLAGYILELYNGIPEKGTQVEDSQAIYHVLDVQDHRVTKIKIEKKINSGKSSHVVISNFHESA